MFSRWDQFVHIPHCHLAGCKSLRDEVMGMNAASNLLCHLETKPAGKSTFANASSQQPYVFCDALFGEPCRRRPPKAPSHNFPFKNKLFNPDASVDPRLTLFSWAKFRTAKAGVTEANIAKLFRLPKGSIVAFDRGQIDHAWFRQLCQSGVFLVTRLKWNARLLVLERNLADRARGVTSDQMVQVANGDKALILRRIDYRNQETGKRFNFLNHMTLPARAIADFYKDRWQVGIFFRFIEQNLRIKSFLGNSKNAVLSQQIYAALIAYLLLP